MILKMMMTWRWHYREISRISSEINYILLLLLLKGGCEVRKMWLLLDNGTGMNNMRRMMDWSVTMRGRTMRHRRRLFTVLWTVSWVVWWWDAWGGIWIWGVNRIRPRIGSLREELPSGSLRLRASDWTIKMWSWWSLLWHHKRCRRSAASSTEIMPLTLLVPTGKSWVGRRYVTLRSGTECWLWCLSTFIFFRRKKCEWITRWMFESLIDPSCNLFLSGQVTLIGIGWIVVLCHIHIIEYAEVQGS